MAFLGISRLASLVLTLAAAAALLVFAAPRPGQAETLDDVKAAAAKEGRVLWYDSMPRDQGDAILAEFHKAYPAIKPEYLEVPGSEKDAKLTQESLAGGPTADVAVSYPSAIMRQAQMGFAMPVDWKMLGVTTSTQLTPTEYFIAVAASTYGVLYNTTKTSDGDAPKSYDALLDPKWKGRVGTWALPDGMACLSALWGEERTTALVKKFAELQPRSYRSTYALAESVGAGEIDLSEFGIYHTSQPTIRKGAPVKWIFIEPIPVAPLYGYLLKEGTNHNAGMLLLKWLGSPEGALAYERITLRGNPFIPETETAKMLAGKQTAMYDPKTESDNADKINALEKEFGRIIQGR